ncbi:hypothetical protein [Kingella negevensis]|uniref:hypothetical protein n=1 Tax=Kingella negevensis TaxID=1522312 RepID=UPI00050A0219|nr:hypothetical protein [Kingella negevensis]
MNNDLSLAALQRQSKETLIELVQKCDQVAKAAQNELARFDLNLQREVFCRKHATAWKEKRDEYRNMGDFEQYDHARRECNAYAGGLPKDEQAEFLEIMEEKRKD